MLDNESVQNLLINLLNIDSSQVEKIDSSHLNDEMIIILFIKSDVDTCPVCSTRLIGNGYYPREIHVSCTPLEKIKVRAKIHRMRCPRCRRSFSSSCCIVPENKSLSYSSIQKIMELLKEPGITFTEVSAILSIPVSTVIRTFDEHCEILRQPFPEALCIDEVYTKNNSFNSKYSCIFYDFERHTVIDVLPSRKKNYLASHLTKIPKAERDKVKFICIDMYRPYRDISEIYFKKAIICVDSFHVVKHLNDDLNSIRIRIYSKYESDSIEYYLLNKFKFLLFERNVNLDNKGKYNKRLKRYVNYRDILEMMLSIDEDLEEGYRLKELYTNFNSTFSYESAKEYMDVIIEEFVEADIYEYREFTEILKNWKDEIINSFIRYKGERLNNGVAESINESIAKLIYCSKGIRNAERRRKRIMYAINKKGFILK